MPSPNSSNGGHKRSFWSQPWVWIACILILAFLLFEFLGNRGAKTITTQQGLDLLKQQGSVQVDSATINGPKQIVSLQLDNNFSTTIDGKTVNYGKDVQFYYVLSQGAQVAQAVEKATTRAGYKYNSIVPNNSVWSSLLTSLLPLIILFLLFWWAMSKLQSGAGGIMGMGGKKSNRLPNSEIPKTKFADVAGEPAAVQEVEEIKDFLKDPSKYRRLGARIPRGVLLYGPPGTGKTLLARAIAGEAGVPFYAMAGSDFVEMFVGLGASRVRELFDEAKKHAPAIIFIDEIDAVGRKRGSGMTGGHDEREQTLNQLLVEMDGFNNDTGIIVIAATNRPDVLDKALLRPGRFDRQVAVEAPDLQGREAILKVHAKGKPFVPNIDLHLIAIRTPGFTGADLANVLNEAALLTARSNAQLIDMRAIDEAIDRVMAGPRRQWKGMALDELRNTAYHESGHALVAACMHHTDPVTKVTILPRGRALGYTAVMPQTDKYSETRDALLDQMAYAMGGRTAEEIVFHDPTTGASNDIEKATNIARAMVLQYGFSQKLGAIKWGDESDSQDAMEDIRPHPFSEKTQEIIDQEVLALVENAHTEAWRVINQNRAILDEMVKELMEKETLGPADLKRLFANVIMSPERPQWLSNPSRPVSDIPPVPIPEKLVHSIKTIDTPSQPNAESNR
ncbi:MAG: ATP-dependent zinc metalloprotease FtsH [Aeriscardovia sp.]|nr:ATP-dependent zinc metalloprotease FtsH [Aeriscardovia sp.]MBO6019428.1 ATP-dependent zinc metalloprotease FtsH [Aeriscardovia sp.]MBO6050283.1 ATP-dependent zinc metalloprotease FtsH [Aeriscardovia sp.]MBO7717541.1 ATP-dependent zinc metalloprotease FtsH [Aeriscardovia sp.]